MPHAILTPDGQLRQVVPKLLPTMQIAPGERIVAFDPPPADPELQTITPVLPVPADAQVVQFVVADRPDAPAKRRDREIKSFTAAIQYRLDAFAQTRGYDNMLSACTYATSGQAQFKAEGQRCVALRDTTWAAAYTILAQVDAGTRPMPATLADIEGDLPVMEWLV